MPAQSEHINGCEIFCETEGEGPPLLLMSGFTGLGADWKLADSHWTQPWRFVRPDLRGHGHSTNPTGQFTFRQAADDVLTLLDRLHIETFSAIGLSAGGNILLHLATAHPDRVKAMVLISATPYIPAQARALMRQYSLDALPPAERESLRQRHPGGAAQIEQLAENIRSFATSVDDLNFTSPLLATIRARTLVVQGDRDYLYPVELSVEMYRAIPGAQLWVIPDAGHGPVFDRLPEFIKVAESFLTGS